MVVCKADQEINPKTGRCIKRCAPGTVRNPNTMRCIKGAPATKKSATVAKKSASATKKNKCKADQEINPKTGRCIKKCAPGTIRNPNTGRCIKIATAAAAPSVAATPPPPPVIETPPSPGDHALSLDTTAKVKRRALFLNTICSDADVCLAFGNEDRKIKRFFDGFTTFKYALPDIKRVGAVSANGFVNMLEYEREGYKSHAIIKSAIKPYVDNLYYEYLVGEKFINAQKRRFPCFVETYGVLQYKDRDIWTKMQEKDKNMPDLDNNFILLNNNDPSNLRRSCLNSQYMAILIENIKGAETVADMMKTANFNDTDLLYVLFQVYAPLSHLCDNFTHYDLHYRNVLCYCPFEARSYIEFHYYLAPGKPPISFKSSYIAKIIDYGRSYYNAGKGVYDNSKSVYEKVCQPVECKKKCGDDVGYEWLSTKSTKANYYISAKKKNISHDLRFLKIVREILNDRIIHVNFLKTGLFDNIVYKSDYGTPENVKSGYKTGDTKPHINNVVDAFNVIRDCMMRPEFIAKNDNYYSKYTKSGDLHVYFDGRPMKFVAATAAP